MYLDFCQRPFQLAEQTLVTDLKADLPHGFESQHVKAEFLVLVNYVNCYVLLLTTVMCGVAFIIIYLVSFPVYSSEI